MKIDEIHKKLTESVTLSLQQGAPFPQQIQIPSEDFESILDELGTDKEDVVSIDCEILGRVVDLVRKEWYNPEGK